MSRIPRIASTLLALASGAAPATAQTIERDRTAVTGRADATFATGYRWRGVWRSDAPVLQADLAGGVVGRTLALTVGGWAVLEVDRAQLGARRDRPIGERGWTEWNAWVQGSARFDRLSLAAGAIRRTFERTGDDPSVDEVYLLAHLQRDRLGFGLEAWQAVAGGHGAYLEPSIGFVHGASPFAGPAFELATRLLAGFQLGRRLRPGDDVTPGLAGTGFTRAALATSVAVSGRVAGPVALAGRFTVEAEVRRDPAVRLTRDFAQGRRFRVWFPLELSLTIPSRRRP